MHRLDSRSKSNENMVEHRRKESETNLDSHTQQKDNRSVADSSTNKNMQDDKIFTTSKNGVNNN